MITPEQAAKTLNITPARVRQLCVAGRLPAIKISNVWLIKESDLRAFSRLKRPTGRPKKGRRRTGLLEAAAA